MGHKQRHAGLEPLLTSEQVADYLGIPVATLYDWRTDGKAPACYRVGKHTRYTESAIRDWLEANRDDAASADQAGR